MRVNKWPLIATCCGVKLSAATWSLLWLCSMRAEILKLFDPLVNPLRRPAFSQCEQNILSLPSITSHLSQGNLSLHSDLNARHFGLFSGGAVRTSMASGITGSSSSDGSPSSVAFGLWKKLLRLVCLAMFDPSHSVRSLFIIDGLRFI